MNIGILKESKEETRVSVTPDIVDALKKIGATVLVEKGAGEQSYYHDEDYKKLEQVLYLVKMLLISPISL